MPTTTLGPTGIADLPPVEVVNAAPRKGDVLVLGLAGDGDQLQLLGAAKEIGLDEAAVLQQVQDLGGSAKAGRVTRLPRTAGQLLVVVGLGEDEPSPDQVRRSVGAAARAATGSTDDEGKDGVALTVCMGLDHPELVRAAVEGALLGSHQYAKVGNAPRRPLAKVSIVSPLPQADVKQALADARAVCAAVMTARDWINTPANLLYPESFAEQAGLLARGSKLEVEVLDEKALAKQGFGGILAVGGGSARPPRLVRVDHHPRGARNHLVLVGKGITFDTGGLNLKPADGMYTMKDDMSGAAAVLAATRAIADLGLDVWVTCYAAMAENMPSGSAYRPSDVVTMYGGTTVENVNSDAEGRIVMADALARSQADDPSLVVDVATLTGAAVVALGLRTAALMTSDDATADLVLDAAETAGEDFWQLPVPQHIADSLDSHVADLKSGGPRQGGALVAAAFLQRFVEPGTAWAHLDIAGPAFNDDQPYDHVPRGGTGAAVATLVELARALQD